MDKHLLQPFSERVDACKAEVARFGGVVKLARCPVCAYLSVDEVIDARSLEPPEPLHSAPAEAGGDINAAVFATARHSMRLMKDGECPRCNDAARRSPEVFQWVMAVVAQAQQDAGSQAEEIHGSPVAININRSSLS